MSVRATIASSIHAITSSPSAVTGRLFVATVTSRVVAALVTVPCAENARGRERQTPAGEYRSAAQGARGPQVKSLAQGPQRVREEIPLRPQVCPLFDMLSHLLNEWPGPAELLVVVLDCPEQALVVVLDCL
jgi:hypothetical protein